MRLEDLQISQEMFFKVGMGCFSLIAIANIATLIIFWNITHFMAKLSGIGGIIFNIALVLFFNYLLNMSKPQIQEQYASDDVQSIIKEIKKENEHIRTKKKTKKKKPKA